MRPRFGDGGREATWGPRRIGPVYATGGMVAAAHPLVTAGGGPAQAIARDPGSGVLAGGADPRVAGMVAGF